MIEVRLDRADDAEILNFARNTSRICITLDHDFHTHLALTGAGKHSVIFLRAEGIDAQWQAEFIRAIVAQCKRDLHEGAAVSADFSSVRIRRLPLREAHD